MTIRDLLSINQAWFNDYSRILKDDEIVLPITRNLKLHPAWLDCEIKSYVILPHEDDVGCYSVANCDYIITITGSRIIQDKRTCVDKALNERIKDNESTNND